MKKPIALLLLLSSLLSLAACGAINKTEVSVLWSDMEDAYLAEVADALDRAMYIENIKHTDYDADGSAARQFEQAEAAIAAGAAALVVSATDGVTAAAILEKAKAADIPLVFLCGDTTLVDAALIASYEKCAAVNVDTASLVKVLGDKIAADLIENYKEYDRNGDGKITYAAFGAAAAAVPTVDAALAKAEKPALVAGEGLALLPTAGVTATVDAIFDGYDGTGETKNATPVELILTDDDAYVPELLAALRRYELNFQKLVTHAIPLYTVGIAEGAGILLDTDDEKEKAAYTVMSTIDSGYVSAAALENDDELALATATILKNLIKGNAMLDDVNESYVNGKLVLVPYTIYE